MRVAGVDADTKTITIFVPTDNGDSGFRFRIEAKGRRAEDRFLTLAKQMQAQLSRFPLFHECDYIYVERPFVGPNRKAAIDMGMVVGVLRGELVRLDVPHSLVDPAVWKTKTLGTSRVSKEEIKQWAMVRFGLEDGLAQDFYDSACIAAYGMQVMGKGK